jgi:hypothetical protein
VLATTENVKVGGNGNEPAIGKPIVNVKVHLLDQHLRPIPVEWRASYTWPGPDLRVGIGNVPV